MFSEKDILAIKKEIRRRFFDYIKENNETDFEKLLKLGVNPNKFPFRDLLYFSAMYGRTNMVKMLLQRGSPPDRPNESGITPLMSAAYYNHPEVVELLSKYPNVDLDRTDKYGDTALGKAVAALRVETTELLLAKGADPDAGPSLLSLIRSNYYTRRISLLIAQKDPPIEFDTRKCNERILGIYKNCSRIALMLLLNGIKYDPVKDKDILSIAAYAWHHRFDCDGVKTSHIQNISPILKKHLNRVAIPDPFEMTVYGLEIKEEEKIQNQKNPPPPSRPLRLIYGGKSKPKTDNDPPEFLK